VTPRRHDLPSQKAGSLLATFATLACAASAQAADHFDGALLTIPTMTVRDVVYSDVVMTVGKIISGPTVGPAYGTVDSYSVASGQLTVPEVIFGGKTYNNVVVTVKDLVSVGSVSSADTYLSSGLSIPEVQVGGNVYDGVGLSVSPANVVTIAGGMPLAALDQYDVSAGQLLIPVVQVGARVYTNVTIAATISAVTTIGGGGAPIISQVTTPGQISGLALSQTGVPYFLDQTNSSVGYITASGTAVEYGNLGPNPAPIEGVFGPGGFANPAFGADGNLYVPFNYGNAIGQLNPANSVFTPWSIPTANAGPLSVVRGPDNALWFTEATAGQIGRVTLEGVFSEFPLPSGSGASPQQIVVGPDGALWFTESGAGKIGRIPVNATPADPQVTEFPMSYPGCLGNGLTSGPLNSLWYVGCYGNFVYSIDQVSTTGQQTIYAAPAGIRIADPRFVSVGADGALWISDQNANVIDRLVPTGGGLGSWNQYAYPLVHQGCCGNASGNWIFGAPDGSVWWAQFNTGNIGHLVP
jgi:virginiamycin B lyase